MRRSAFAVSVVVSAQRAGSTIGPTLDSLLAQTMTQWHAIVVVDRDADHATTSVVERFATLDSRIAPIRPGIDGCAAALRESPMPWVLVLDAGDVLRPEMLERIRDALAADDTLDAVLCGWTITDAPGRVLAERRCEATGDLFDLLARHAAFPSAACVARRTVIEAAGGFAQSVAGEDDWLRWQRVARRGARFGRVAAALVDLPGPTRESGSDPLASLDAALRVISLGHGVDPDAGLTSDAPYFEGRLASADPAVLALVCCFAGELLATGRDALVLLDRLPPRPVSDVSAAAAAIIESAAIAAGRTHGEWGTLWAELRPSLDRFLAALEDRLQRPGLARAMVAEIQRLVLPFLSSPLPDAVAGSHTMRVEITAPIQDVELSPDTERLQMLVLLEGATVGVLELPAPNVHVAASEIRQAIADAYAWRILGRVFDRTVNGELRATLVDQLWAPDPVLVTWAMRVIDRIAASIRGNDDGRHRGMPRPLVVEVGRRVPWFTFGARNIAAELRVANVPVAATEIVVGRARVLTAKTLRAALTGVAGDALARVVVRELLLGVPFDRTPLRERLARRASPNG
jgi:glycosyl transferase family 2